MDARDVSDRTSFLAYVAKMRADLATRPQSWENTDLKTFIEAAQSWVEDASFAEELNPWQHAAMVLQAGALYE